MQQMACHGKDGWLYLDGGNNPFLAYLKGQAVLPQSTIQGWRDLLKARHRRLTKMGISYCHVFAPEKASVYPEYLNEDIDVTRGIIYIFSRHFPDLFINVLPFFNKIKKDFQIYYKTDTHWNFAGCFAAYQLICGHFKIFPNKAIVSAPVKNVNALLDLGSKTNPQTREWIKVRAIQQNYKRVFVNTLIEYKEKNKIENEVGLHVGSHAIFENKAAPYQQKVVIFGDSFSEYRPTLLTAMLAETFAEVHFIWSANIDYEYIKRVKPDIVITEICERFAGIVPNDIFNLNEFEKSRMESYLATMQKTAKSAGLSANVAKNINEVTPVASSAKNQRKLPDYLIIGSMKCGTTILNDFICLHPDVAPAKQKEIHYFSMHYDKGLVWYTDFFSDVPDGKIVGDASPTYFDMGSNIVLPRLINATLPKAKIIVILKNPITRAISHFFHLRDINKLEAFQHLDPNEIFSEDLVKKYHTEFALNPKLRPLRFVLDCGNYFFKLEAYREVFRDRLLILKNKDLWSTGQLVMDKVFRHIGLREIQSDYFNHKDYVTTEKQSIISKEAIDSLAEFYATDLLLLKNRFDLDLTK